MLLKKKLNNIIKKIFLKINMRNKMLVFGQPHIEKKEILEQLQRWPKLPPHSSQQQHQPPPPTQRTLTFILSLLFFFSWAATKT